MLILQTLIKRQSSSLKHGIFIRHLTAKTKIDSDLMTDFKHSLPALKPKKAKREPFAKNLFAGVVDYEFLAYPEPQHVDRYNEFEEWLLSLTKYMETLDSRELENNGTIPHHILERLKELGIFGTRIHEEYKGMNLLNSEFLRVLETVGTIPALGMMLLKQSVGPINMFNKYCSVEQKWRYLPNISTGQLFPTLAISEKTFGPGNLEFTTMATYSKCNDYWILNGEKSFVANTNIANVFIVFGHALTSRPETLSSFIVEKGTEGLIVQENVTQNVGLKGFNMGKLILNNVKIPKANLIGKIGDGTTQLANQFTDNRHYIVGLMIPLLKNFLKLLTKEVVHRKHFDIQFRDLDATHKIFTNIISSIYCMESALYLTSAMTDIYDQQDIMLESALVEQYCVEECLKRIQESISVVGPKACSLIDPYEQIFRDAYTIVNYDTSLMDTKIFSGLLGLQYSGKMSSDKIKMYRNPLMHPTEVLKSMFLRSKEHLNLHMEDYLHPSFKDCIHLCDVSLLKLIQSTELVLARNGFEVSEKHMELQRISEMASYIYAYIAMAGRASRSYCIGHRNSEIEVKICFYAAYDFFQKIKQLAEDIKESPHVTGDSLCKELSDLSFQTKGYYLQHPLSRNY